MTEALAEVLAIAFFFMLAVVIIGAFITWVFDRESSPTKLTQTQARNRARWVLFRVNAYLFKRKVFRSIKFWSN